MTCVHSLTLQNFRSYREARLQGLASSFVVLTGANGAGKTNLLEAVSFLSPGKGLRSADLPEVQNRLGGEMPWGVSAIVETEFGPIRIGTGRTLGKERRAVHIQGEAVKSQSVLSEYLSCLWLTPQMDRLFMEAAAARRRFLDRMIFAFDVGHSGRMTRYENALSQRSRLLKEGKADSAWLDALEQQMVESGMAVAAARVEFVSRLGHVCQTRGGADFPIAELALSGFIENKLGEISALKLEEMFLRSLAESRAGDALSGGASLGPHRSDFLVTYHEKQMPAGQCSTGEQKALLIGLVLAHSDLIRAERGRAPLLLLDEVAAHLDEARRAALFNVLARNGGQVWVTGTDASLFSAISQESSFFMVEDGKIQSR